MATINGASYNVNTGVLTLDSTAGSTDVIDYNKLTLKGQGVTATLTLTGYSTAVAGTSASITLSTNDQATLKGVFDQNGISSSDGTIAFNLSAIAGWDQSDSTSTVSGALLSISGYANATAIVTSVVFSADTGSLADLITKTELQTSISGAFSGSLAPGQHVQLSLNNGLSWVNANIPGDNAWSVSSVHLGASNTLQVRVTSGTASTTPLIKAYVLDTTAPAAPPTPTLATASDTGTNTSDGITKTTTPVINGTAEVGSIVTLYDNNGTVLLGTSAIVDIDGLWSITSSTLSESVHSLQAKATDAAGNASALSTGLQVTVDTTAPAASTIFLSAGSDAGATSTDGITNRTTPTFSGLAEINSTVKLFDGSTLVATTTANGTNGNWSVATALLAEGPHTITAQVTDAAGNTGVASSGIVLNVDLTAPVLASATVNGNKLLMTYNEALDAVHVPGNGAFAVLVGGSADAVTAVAVNSVAKTVTLTLATAASSGQVVTVGYTDPTVGDDTSGMLQDVAGNDAVTLAAQAVTNSTPAPPSGGGGTPGVTLTAPAAGGTVTGGAGNDTLTGLGGNDTFITGGGKDSINGGAGIDTAVVTGARTDYTLVHNSDGSFTLQSKADGNTTISLANVERISFNGQSLALDVTPTSAKVADMYTLALGRNPEDAGLGYWNDMQVAGQSSLALATGFTNSKEFANLYGGLGDTAFITQFYANAFGRAPDAGGMAFYLDALSHTTGLAGRTIMLANFVDSPEMQVKLAGQIDQGIPLLASA